MLTSVIGPVGRVLFTYPYVFRHILLVFELSLRDWPIFCFNAPISIHLAPAAAILAPRPTAYGLRWATLERVIITEPNLMQAWPCA